LKPSTDSASLVVEVEFFRFRWGVFGGERHKWGCFGYIYLALGPNLLGHYYGSRFIWKLGQNPRL